MKFEYARNLWRFELSFGNPRIKDTKGEETISRAWKKPREKPLDSNLTVQ
jgi:hypothetical protein